MKNTILTPGRIWDFIVIGTGMGGGAAGLRLAQAGHSVLFLEKGRSPDASNAIKGAFAEISIGQSAAISDIEVLKRAGRSSDHLVDVTGSRKKILLPFIGSGVGGSSALYGMVLERFQERDFASWPVSLGEMVPYYESAERLFRVRSAAAPRHRDISNLATGLSEQGLHPYTLPLANDDHPSCGDCQSLLCLQGCKNESGKICVRRAVNDFGAELLTDCEVTKILADGAVATGVRVTSAGAHLEIGARYVLLAAGALMSPLLLKDSASSQFPTGLGNHSNQVGHNLMRHYVDLYALKIDSDPQNKRTKEIAFNDFYDRGWGTVQSFGRLPPANVIFKQILMKVTLQGHSWLAWLLKALMPLAVALLDRAFQGRLVMATITEDEPCHENRVWREDGQIKIHYTISPADSEKIKQLRAQMKTVFRRYKTWFLPSAENSEMLAHVCGTCRMGNDAKTSVVDSNNRVHGTENVYVVDASFFPTSGGTNPALTIAANALRVAEIIIAHEKSRGVTPSREER